MRNPTPEGGPERLVALADGVFAIAITLLVLDLSVPQGLDSEGYHQALDDLLPNLGAYAISLAVLAGFWRDHRAIFRTVRQVDGQVISLTVLGLGIAALLPFPTALVSEYGEERSAVIIYAVAVASLGGVHLVLTRLIARRPWLRDGAAPVRDETLSAVDLGATVVVFLVTIPLALLVGSGAMWWWLVLVPVKVWLGRRENAAR
ncbi:TMEM175 family protein [Streptomyces griseomycini]|uniref:Membrane protein n=1 Tax=Streptomyces griseomycini TaxID=66895 RepID=A0A7W7PUK8_9ACTN|nr:TMEM175 family protein [Streptomyces griseomycini]MBB4901608.1 putative membrane protein [Streptomyces griseomycini]